MSEYLPDETPHERLARALGSAELQSLTNGRTYPLTIEQLRLETPGFYKRLVTGDTFPEIVEKLGWPDETDVFEHPQREYRSPEDFKNHLTMFSAETDYPNAGLNNFYRPLVADPYDPSKEYGIQDILHIAEDLRPHVARAEVLAPELISSLRLLLKQAREESKKGGGVPHARAAYDDPRIVDGMYAAYRLMGRLVKSDDEIRQAHMMSAILDVHTEVIHLHHVTDAHRALTQ